jgi:hypothetical protein
VGLAGCLVLLHIFAGIQAITSQKYPRSQKNIAHFSKISNTLEINHAHPNIIKNLRKIV